MNLLMNNNNNKREVGIVVDNAGYELVSDLILGNNKNTTDNNTTSDKIKTK